LTIHVLLKRNRADAAPDFAESLYPLLFSYAEVERECLGSQPAGKDPDEILPTDVEQECEAANEPDKKKRAPRVVQFAGFDGTAIAPPVDRVNGSHVDQRAAIESLVCTKHLVDDFILSHRSSASAMTDLSALLLFFHGLLEDAWSSLSLICAESMPREDRDEDSNSNDLYPVSRILTAVKEYCREFTMIQIRAGTASNSIQATADCGLFVERRLSTLVGQSLRYQLRWLLNPAPPRLGKADEGYAARSELYSKVANFVELKQYHADPEDIRDFADNNWYCHGQDVQNEAAEDKFFSAVVSKALSGFFDCFGPDQPQRHFAIPHQFCQSPASHHPTPVTAGRNKLPTVESNVTNPFAANENLVQQIKVDMNEAASFWMACRSAQFLLDFLEEPRIRDELATRGGWREVERLAGFIRQFDLSRFCPEDAHLVLLDSYVSLVRKLRRAVDMLLPRMEDCRRSLNDLASRFFFSDVLFGRPALRQRVAEKIPELILLAQYWSENRKNINMIPQVRVILNQEPA
jgi:hypothetical protein